MQSLVCLSIALRSAMSASYSLIPNFPNAKSDPLVPYLIGNVLTDLKTSDINNSLIHLYRGELGRQIVYRQRLDQSTQYAVTIASTLTVLSFAYSTVPSYVHLLIAFFVLVFCVLETRRYMYYHVIKHRVRQLELGYYGRYILGPKWQLDTSNRSTVAVQLQPPATTSLSADSSPRAANGMPLTNGRIPPLVPDTPVTPSLETPLWATSSLSNLSNVSDSPQARPPRECRSHSIEITDSASNPNLWVPALVDSLLRPRITVTFFHACCVRLYRVYCGLLLGVYIGYIMKVSYVNDWSHQTAPVIVVGLLVTVMTVWVYFYFPRTLRDKRWQKFYWTNEEFTSEHAEIDV